MTHDKTAVNRGWGLNDNEVTTSRKQHGDNVLTPPKRVSLWKLYLDKYRDPIIEILVIAALISLVLAFVQNDFIETIGIFIAIFLATTVGFYFERDAEKKFRVLTALNEDQPVKVRRNGKVTEIPRRDVVVGDVILVEVGDEIPADAELLTAVNLQVDESSLTGELLTTKAVSSNSAENKAEQPACHCTVQQEPGTSHQSTYPQNLILRSTMVMNGHAEAVVVRVGDATEIGKVTIQSNENTHVKTPLNLQLNRLARLISQVGATVAVLAFLVFLVHDILTNTIWHSHDYLGMARIVLNYFMMAVTLIVMAVPEGLPMAVNLALALNMRRMLKSNNLVRKLHASETMGATTVICTDKTGTLTENRMSVSSMLLADAPTGQDNANPDAESRNSLFYMALAVNTTAELDNGRPIGNPTEGALLMWLEQQGQDYRQLREACPIIDQKPFSTETKLMATTVSADGKTYTFVKGAPEMVLRMTNLSDADRLKVKEILLTYQRQAMRTLAFAYCEGGFRTENLTYQGVTGICDPVRTDVPAAVRQCRRAGIEVKMITGDTSATAIEIAHRIGIWPKDDDATEAEKHLKEWHITGADFAALTDDEAYERAKHLRIMSRARPADKQRLVQLLQKRGEIVAVTGDGTNDAPALNHAHVGLSLGTGTSVAKQASDITLLDDSFHSIASAVMWGRSLYKNIQRFLFFQLVVNLSALLLVLGGSVIGTEIPLTVTQILWVNIIMDTFAALALASLPPSREVMKDQPRRTSDFIITHAMWRGISFCSISFFVVMFVFLIWCERHGQGSIIDVHELTLFFTTFVMLQFWNLFNAKSLGSAYSAFRYFWRDRGLVLVLTLILFGQWLIVTFGGRMFRTQPMSLSEWLAIIASTGFVVLGSGELWRWVKRIRERSRTV